MSNLSLRILTALVLVIALGGVLFALSLTAATIAFALIAALAAWEWGGLMKKDRMARLMYAGLLLLFCWQLRVGVPAWLPWLPMVSTVFWVLLAPIWLWRGWSLAGNDFVAYALGLLLLLATWAALLALYALGPWVLLATMALVWVADIAAYAAGRAWGRRKLAPHISPGKTWEGVAGAMMGVLVYGFVIWLTVPAAQRPSAFWLLVLPALTAVSIVGDLFESLLKRQAGVKDSSNLLPGHGGVLDRIDSLIATLPLAALLLQVIVR
jgi:phosphatidate cytidylyltransferase